MPSETTFKYRARTVNQEHDRKLSEEIKTRCHRNKQIAEAKLARLKEDKAKRAKNTITDAKHIAQNSTKIEKKSHIKTLSASQNERSQVNRKTKPTQLDRKTPIRRSKVVNKIHHLSPILEQDIDEEELFMQELEEERERQMREVEEALFLEEYITRNMHTKPLT